MQNKIELKRHDSRERRSLMRPTGLSRKLKQLVVSMTQPCNFVTTTNPLLLSRPTSYAPRYSHSLNFTTKMTNNNNEEQDHLNALFKQKQLLRSRVRKDLKNMDPTLRSQEGNFLTRTNTPNHFALIFFLLGLSRIIRLMHLCYWKFFTWCCWFLFSDNAIQSIVLESPWFKSSQRLCAYISCSSLREVDTSKLLSEILQNPAQGLCLLAVSYVLVLPSDIQILCECDCKMESVEKYYS